MLGATMGGYSLAKILSALVTLLVCLTNIGSWLRKTANQNESNL